MPLVADVIIAYCWGNSDGVGRLGVAEGSVSPGVSGAKPRDKRAPPGRGGAVLSPVGRNRRSPKPLFIGYVIIVFVIIVFVIIGFVIIGFYITTRDDVIIGIV